MGVVISAQDALVAPDVLGEKSFTNKTENREET